MARKLPLIELTHPITKELFAKIDKAVRKAGYSAAIEWSENIQPPASAKDFAAEAIYVICNSGFANRIAVPIFERVMFALGDGKSSKKAFGHPGKTDAIDYIWKHRIRLFKGYNKAADKIEYCSTLPWIGPITKYHLAKNFGADVAKPDVHLNRLADLEAATAQELCERLSALSGYRISTVDIILWRAMADRLIQIKKDRSIKLNVGR